ncbi:MAG: hypothetical protein JXA54_05375 [Candidatus Heimdallarchaeota archaeon]|nr:hypothetical protein [Candidatus Heimdallarchaeota archaeon]
MDSQIIFNSENTIKLSDEALDDLLNPIPNDIFIEKIAAMKEWKTKRPPLENDQTKREYLLKHLGNNLTLGILREIRTLREHCNIAEFKWNVFSYDKSIARYYPDKIKKKIEDFIKDLDSLVNIDLLIVDEESQTLFLLLEQWKKEVVADTILSKIETKIPKHFRIYFSIAKKFVLIQDKSDLATKEFISIFENAFNVKTELLKINAMVIREFVKAFPNELQSLIVKVPQEVVGFGGLSELTIRGSDVIKGSKGLMDRHETSPIMVGPWVGVSNKDLELKVGESVKTSSITNAIVLFDLMKELC